MVSFRWKGAKTLRNKTLISIAEKYGKTPAQIALRFLLQLDIMIIPKTVNKDRMKENFDIFNFKIKDEDMKILSDLDTGRGGSWPSTMREEFY